MTLLNFTVFIPQTLDTKTLLLLEAHIKGHSGTAEIIVFTVLDEEEGGVVGLDGAGRTFHQILRHTQGLAPFTPNNSKRILFALLHTGYVEFNLP